ncbi:MAG TPA: NPCBM/NEW2 domain-containing protein [Phycisphaerae bacterium]
MVLALGCAAVLADEYKPATADITVRTIDPDPLHGRIVHWSLSGELVIEESAAGEAGGVSRRIPSDQIVRIDLAAEPPDAARRTPLGSPSRSETARKQPAAAITLDLVGGDRLIGTCSELRPQAPSELRTGESHAISPHAGGSAVADVGGSASDDEVTLITASAGPITVPLEFVSAVRTAAAAMPRWREALDDLRHRAPAEDDALLLTNGDVLHGLLRRVGANGIAFEQAGSELVVPLERVVAALLAPTPSPAAAGLRARAALADGSRLTAAQVEWSGDHLEIEAFGGRRLTLPMEHVQGIDVTGGRWGWLSSIEPVSDQHTPMLDLARHGESATWPRVINANVLGEPLHVGGRTFAYGIGVHSASMMRFDLAGEYKTFVTSFGLDDDSGPYADVSVEIHVDGRRCYQEANVRPGTLHGEVRLDIAGAKSLELIVGFGENGDVQDRFDWVEPALIR